MCSCKMQRRPTRTTQDAPSAEAQTQTAPDRHREFLHSFFLIFKFMILFLVFGEFGFYNKFSFFEFESLRPVRGTR